MELEVLHELLKNTSDKVNSISDKLIESQILHKETHRRLEKIELTADKLNTETIKQTKDIEENKDSLIEHMKRTDYIETVIQQNKDILNNNIHKVKLSNIEDTHQLKEEVAKRLNKIEQPSKVRQFLFDMLVKVGGGAGAMYAIIRMIDYFK